MNTQLTRFTVLLPALLVLSLPAQAVQGLLYTHVTRTLTTADHTYGGCMAAMAAPISSASNGPNCPSTWVAFSCDGTYASKDAAYHMFDQAQLALALDKSVLVVVDDSRKHNGYCLATRLDVY